MSNTKKIILHGQLAELYSKPIEVEATSIAEALRSLTQIEELAPPPGQPWPVTVVGVNSDVALYSETAMDEIHVHPLTSGSKKNGVAQVLIGITLVTLAIVNPAFIAPLAQYGITTGQLMLSGALMITGGLLQMMMPVPQIGTDETESSRYLGAARNTVKIGTRIPICYGFNRLGGHYLSFDVDAVDWAGDTAGTGAATVVEDSIFVEHDKTPLTLPPPNPVFASQTPGPGNIPTSAWMT